MIDLTRFTEKKYYGFEVLGKTITLSDKVRISDPGYDIDTWCAGTLENVLPGKYECRVQYYENRIAKIAIFHEDHLDIVPNEEADIDVGVDSGQCGIFDLDYFSKNCKKESWYFEIGSLTYKDVPNPNYKLFHEIYPKYKDFDIKKEQNVSTEEQLQYLKCLMSYNRSSFSCETISVFAADCIDDKAFVCSSGYGDGSYICKYGKVNGKIVSVELDFI